MVDQLIYCFVNIFKRQNNYSLIIIEFVIFRFYNIIKKINIFKSMLEKVIFKMPHVHVMD